MKEKLLYSLGISEQTGRLNSKSTLKTNRCKPSRGVIESNDDVGSVPRVVEYQLAKSARFLFT